MIIASFFHNRWLQTVVFVVVILIEWIGSSAEAGEYADCISAKG